MRAENPPEILNGGTFSEFAARRKGGAVAKTSEVTADVHAAVEDADDFDPAPTLNMNDEMGTAGKAQIPGLYAIDGSTFAIAFCQALESLDQISIVGIGLRSGPFFE
ncbi:hypothetical protein J2858_003281 [Neorhizobium galegae]|nr:hypothetical protein [Neorhizobium galegae]